MPDRSTERASSADIEVWEWRAVGYDNPNAPDSDGQVYECSDWTTERRAAERAAAAFRADEPPFDDVWIERRRATFGEPERVA